MNLTGQLLVSMPSLEDERFFKTVIYMCAHSKEGAMGIIINKKIDYDLYPDLLEQLGIDKPLNNKKLFIRYGGPVESGRGFVLHSDEITRHETLPIDKGIALTSKGRQFEISQGISGANLFTSEAIFLLSYQNFVPIKLQSKQKTFVSNSALVN